MVQVPLITTVWVQRILGFDFLTVLREGLVVLIGNTVLHLLHGKCHEQVSINID
jgi:hypothetical protein